MKNSKKNTHKTKRCKIWMRAAYLSSFVLPICIAANLHAQTTTASDEGKTYKKNLKTAYILTEGGTPNRKDEPLIDTTITYFLECYKQDSSNANVAYLIGRLYLSTGMHKSASLPYEERAVKDIKKKYYDYDISEKHAPPLAYYYLARAQHVNYQFDNAIESFNTFKKLLKPTEPKSQDADYWIACCNNAKQLMQNPVDCRVIDLGETVNSVYDDFAPVITADESEMYFTSKRHKAEDTTKGRDGIMLSVAGAGGVWGAPQDPGPPLNILGGNSATSYVSPDGQSLIVYHSANINSEELYLSNISEGNWVKPALIDSISKGNINSNSNSENSKYFTPSACMTPDGKTLYFSSDRPGGTGGLDLYKSVMQSDGSWVAPVNLGTNINTKYDEDCPFVSFDGSLLFFSSKGHNTMGGYDVFMCKSDASGNWGDPQNLGYPVNTPDDDKYFVLSADGKRGYYNTVRLGTLGERDIYEVIFNTPLPVQCIGVLVAYVKGAEGGPVPAGTKVTCTGGGTSTSVPVNMKTGKFIAILKATVPYTIVITANGKQMNSYNYTVPMDSSNCAGKKSFYNGPITLGDTTNIFRPKPVPIPTQPTPVAKETSPFGTEPYFVKFFGYNLDNVTPKDPDFPTLIRNIEEISKDSAIIIYIESSASTVPTTKWGTNEKLARARAESLKKAITEALKRDMGKQGMEEKGTKGKNKKKKKVKNMGPNYIEHVKFELKSGVNGPEYAHDPKNIEKYRPFQYVKGYLRRDKK